MKKVITVMTSLCCQSKLNVKRKELVPASAGKSSTRFLIAANHLLYIALMLFHPCWIRLSFCTNYTLDDKDHPLPDSHPALAVHTFCDFSILACEVSQLNKSFDFTKVNNPDKISVIVHKILSPELSPILAKLFNFCSKRKCFSGL